MKESYQNSTFESEDSPSDDESSDQNERNIFEIAVDNPENLNITRYEKYIPAFKSEDGCIVCKSFIREGWQAITQDLIIDAGRMKGDQTDYGLVFTDRDSGYDFQALSGKGMFNAKKQIEPFITFLDRESCGKWYASCDDPKRERVYRRWLPSEKIKHE